MAGNTFGTLFTATTFGESHGPALGCVVDGCPAGLPLDQEDIERELRRRRPGGGGAGTTRREADTPEILSGVYGGKTLGTPIAVLVRNTSQKSADYENLKDTYRPGHADWPWEAKYGFRDHRGGGRSSGRETLGRVAAGAVAKALLRQYNVSVFAWTSSAGGIHAPGPGDPRFDRAEAENNPLRIPHGESAARAAEAIAALRESGDSAGGTVSCMIEGLSPGLGMPVFGKLDGLLAGAMLSIGAAKGIEFGAGFSAASGKGSDQNDGIVPPGTDGSVPAAGGSGLPPDVPGAAFISNRAGGILGGLSTGAPVEFTVAFKPIPSISLPQKTITRGGAPADIAVGGRHDVCVCPRAVPVVEAMAALVLADLILISRSDRL
ncbi:chorismate synthase [Breznakiella homolactica]|uniref:Chorismate synthase n=1 Tax=Breznakiella homolactica TaxID=2798577 RepID=A0A7T8BBZ4_9SPIR|nr:chorismate synthase [Breznakiella homolactica]QQO11072.1 chorismate synthase [Breznakiella homolactica]